MGTAEYWWKDKSRCLSVMPIRNNNDASAWSCVYVKLNVWYDVHARSLMMMIIIITITIIIY